MLSIKVSRFVQFDEDDVMHAVKMLTKKCSFLWQVKFSRSERKGIIYQPPAYRVQNDSRSFNELIITHHTWQISCSKPGVKNNDITNEISSASPSRTKFLPEGSSGHFSRRSCRRRRPQSTGGMKSQDEKKSSEIEAASIRREKVSELRSSLQLSYLIIGAFRTRNQSPEVPQM